MRRSDYLNTRYTGPDWIDIGWDKFTAAAETEFVEFLSEMTGEWKWYSNNPRIQRNKALFELVDWFLFTASAIHCANRYIGLDGVEDALVSYQAFGTDPSWWPPKDIGVGKVMVWKSELVVLSEYASISVSIQKLAVTLDIMLGYIGATPADFDQAYEEKYAMCLKRVEAGIMRGVPYDKTKEVYSEILV